MDGDYEIKRVGVELLEAFAGACEKRGLRWYVQFGTLLGAVRHGGFIPWDNDIDVAMPRPDYDCLMSEEEPFAAPYILQTPTNDPRAAPRYMRLHRFGTTAFARGAPSAFTPGGRHNICMDIIPLDDAPGSDRELAGLNVLSRRISQQAQASLMLSEYDGGIPPKPWDERCYAMGGIAGAYDLLTRRREALLARCRGGEDYAMPVFGGVRGMARYRKKWYESSVSLPFEGLSVNAPAGYMQVLAAAYPAGIEASDVSAVERVMTHFALSDANRDYTQYWPRFTDMLKGIDDKRILIFGAGDSLRVWLERFGDLSGRVECAFDNDSRKWGRTAYGVAVKPPSELLRMRGEATRLIIASIYYPEIGRQLEGMGIDDYCVFIDGWRYDR